MLVWTVAQSHFLRGSVCWSSPFLWSLTWHFDALQKQLRFHPYCSQTLVEAHSMTLGFYFYVEESLPCAELHLQRRLRQQREELGELVRHR